MGTTNPESGTNIYEVADGVYRINTPVQIAGGPGGFSFNQYLIVDDEPLLFHTGPRKMFPLVSEAVSSVIALCSLRYVAFSHFEADECGSINEWLQFSPSAVPVCGRIAAMTSINDIANRPARVIQDGEVLSLGSHSLRWFDTPHLPHGWDCGYLMDDSTRTLLCGDLFTQGGSDTPALTESDILGPSESLRKGLDYFAHAKTTRDMLSRLASARPVTLACMHGSAWTGDGSALLMALADALDADSPKPHDSEM